MLLSYLYLITCLLLHRKFGDIIHDIVQKYENVDLSQLRKLEKISIKIGKAELGFLRIANYITLPRNYYVLIYLVETKLTQDLFENAYYGVL